MGDPPRSVPPPQPRHQCGICTGPAVPRPGWSRALGRPDPVQIRTTVRPPAGRRCAHVRYGEYCPIAVGVDVLGDRWTPLVIRELMMGASGFNEIHRGVPRMSRTLLAQRLRQLERRGLVRREASSPGTARPLRADAGRRGAHADRVGDGDWAAEWAFGDPTADELRRPVPAVADAPARGPGQAAGGAHRRPHGADGPGAAEGWLDVERRG